MSFRELLDEPFALIQANIAVLARAALVVVVFAELIVVAITAAAEVVWGSDTAIAWAAGLSTAAGVLLVRFVLRGMTIAVGLADIGGQPIGSRAALSRCAAAIGPLVVYQLMFTLIGVSVLVVGSVLVISYPLAVVWLGYLRAQRFVAVPVMLVEQADYRGAVARSKLLVADAEWPTTGLWLSQRLLIIPLFLPLFGIMTYADNIFGTHRWQVTVMFTAGILLLIAVAEIVDSATRVVSYVDRRCRREGLDIHIPAGVTR